MVGKKINQCRICGSQNLKSVVNLGYQHIQGFFPKCGEPLPEGKGAGMSLVLCDRGATDPLVLSGTNGSVSGCGLLQTQYQLDPIQLYTDYWYKSGTTATMTRHLRELAEEGVMLFTQSRGGALDDLQLRVADLGCNDGTLLSYFPNHFTKYGVDPSNVIPHLSSANLSLLKDDNSDTQPVFIQEFFPSKTLASAVGAGGLDLITSIAMFYDLEEPNAFCREIKRLLAKQGLWMVEVSYMPRMISEGWYDSICHEHVEYYSFSVLKDLFGRHGLRIVKAALNEINGGSILCFVTHEDNDAFDNCILSVVDGEQDLAALLAHEEGAGLFNPQTFYSFQRSAEAHRDQLRALVLGLAEQGKRIHLYGASTKGNTLLQWCNLDHSLIECAAERSPAKIGLMTVGTNIPIVSEEQSRSWSPDYYLVLPWHFRPEILKREKEMLIRGTKFIFPFPAIEVVDGSGVGAHKEEGREQGGGVR